MPPRRAEGEGEEEREREGLRLPRRPQGCKLSSFSTFHLPRDLSSLATQSEGVRPGEEGYDPRTLQIPKRAWAEFTPFETQFWEIKQNHYDTVSPASLVGVLGWR